MVTRLNWAKYGRVLASEYRKKIVLCLEGGPLTPKQVATKTKLYLSHVSHIIHELIGDGVVECLTPQLKRGKLFGLTKEGKEIVNQLKRML